MSDLFDWTPPPKYPEFPGSKTNGTSREAAVKMAPIAKTLRDQVLLTLRVRWPQGLTPDEIAAAMGKSVLSIRPRVTELHKLRAIEPRTVKGVVERRKNESTMSAVVYVAKRSYGEW